MKKNTTKPSTLIFFILLSTSIFANKTPNYPKGFSPKTNAGISFTENKGQIHDQNYKTRPDVLFGGSDGNLVFHLKNNGISYQLNRVDTWKKEDDLSTKKAGFENAEAETKIVADQTTIYRLDINWLNANTDAEVTKQKPLDGFNNYYLENCPNGVLNVKSYQQITYQNIYEGIDLKWYEKDGHLEYDYIVSAGADYKQIQLEIKGADKLTLNNKGELIYKTPLGNIIEQAPLVKQNGKTLKSKWIIKNNVLSFEIENINKNQAFIIDPVVRTWGTYYGGSGGEAELSCATDAYGNVYMAGSTSTQTGTNIATAGSHQSAWDWNTDAFLVKFNSAGIRLWGTYYGSGGVDAGYSCSTDAAGNVYMAGYTDSPSGTSIASSGSHQSNYGGGGWTFFDAFLVKFNSAGIRQWGTYYGGSATDYGYSCSTDASGNVYMAGLTQTSSGSSIATVGSHQTSYGVGWCDAFLVKFNSAGIRQWGTYYGGNGVDIAYSCATDATGNIYITGETTSSSGTSIANLGSHQSVLASGNSDAFLVKFNSSGVRQWGTYYGGTIDDFGYSCATDASGNIYMAGRTSSASGTIIANLGSHQSAIGGGFDAFLVKFNSAGIRQWGTYYGGTGDQSGNSCDTDASGNVYMAGHTQTTSGTSIATLGNHQSTYGGGNNDAYIAQFNSAGIRQWGTYYGGTGNEVGLSCSTDASGNIYMSGKTNSGSSIASLNSHQSNYLGGGNDAFLVKLADNCINANPTITVNSGSICSGQNFTINPNGANTYTIQGGNAVVSPSINTTYTVIGTNTAGCVSQAVATSSLIVIPTPTVNAGADQTVFLGNQVTLSGSGATSYTWSFGVTNGVAFGLLATSVFTLTGSTNGCSATDQVLVTVMSQPTISASSNSICVGQSSSLTAAAYNTTILCSNTGLPGTLNNGLVGYWPFCGNANDASGNGNNGTVNGASLTSDRFGNTNSAYSFNGSSSTINHNTQLIPSNSSFAISFWVKPILNNTFQEFISQNSSPNAFYVGVNGNNMRCGDNWSTTGVIVSNNIWQHYVIVRNFGLNVMIYRDGLLVATSSGNIILGGIGPLVVGKQYAPNQEYYSGIFDDFGIWNRALTPQEITGLFNQGQASYSWTPGGASTRSISVSPTITTTYNCNITYNGASTTQTQVITVNANPSITVNSGAICAGQTFTINPNGANTYTIQGGNAMVSPPSNTSYTVIGTNSVTGCVSQAFATSNLTVNPNPIITVNNGTICAGQNFTINPNGANTYTIQGGNAVVSPPSNAIFTVAGTSTAGCVSQAVATSSLIVNQNPTITVNNGAICAGQNFTINPNGANTYTIQGGSAVVSPTSNVNYTVVGSSTAGCLSQAFATSNLTVNPNPTITVNNGTICVGQNFTINPNGANTYTIQGGNAVVSPAVNSSYTVAGTSTAGCVSQAFATSSLIVNANPIITVNNGAICAGQNFTINPNGANTYTIQGGSAVVSPTSNSSFTVAGTSMAGCVSQAFATSNLTVNPNPTITVNNGTICAGQNFTINPNGSNTYTIQGGNAVVSPAGNTSYTVAGTSTAGCLSQAFATSSLIVNANPSITVNSGAICAGQNFTINPNGANTYTIQGGNAVVSPAGNTSYTVAGTSTAGCLSQAFATSSLIVNPNPTITVNNGAICAGQNFTINPNGANTYTIQGGNAVVSPTSNANYTVVGSSTAGCLSQAFATSNLTVNPNPTITVNNGTICVGQNFTINPNGANTYTIQGGNAVVSPSINTTYTVIGTDTITGCLSQAFATSSLVVNANPIITVNNGTICAGQNFTINPNGANTYTIQGGNAVVSPPSNTSYTVAGTSTAGCLSQAFATSSLIVNANPSITVNSGAICAGQNFTINPNGANTYTIQGGNAVVSPTSNANYTVVGSSTAGCLSQAFATSNLTVNPNPIITVNNGTICSGQNFTINPNGANTYTIQGGNAVVSPSINTTYTVIGTNTAGCVSQAVVTSSLVVNANPIITVNNGTICAGQNFTINPNGANTYTIQGGNAVVSPPSNTSYTVAGTSTAGCLSQAFATSSLIVNANPSITVNSGAICAGQNFTINPNGANTYTIQGGNAVVSPASNTSYTVAGTSTAGCVSQAVAISSLIVNVNPTITVNSGAICAGQNFTINPNGANTYTIQGGSAVVSPAGNTSYTVAGTSTSGCVSQAVATSSLIVNPNPTITVNNGTICAGQNFTINPNGGNTYTIQGGNAVVSPAGNTSYTVAGTSTAGCLSQAVASISLIVNQNPTITVNNGAICAGQNFTINPNGANTYTIQGGNAVVSPPSNTSYTVAGTSTAGCLSQAVATSSLIVNANPSITVNSGAICAGQNFTINPNGANTYTIQGGNAVVSPSINTSYTVVGTSTAGCLSQAVATSSLIVNPNPTITVNNGAICAGESFTISPNGANTYTIQGGNAVVSPTINASFTVAGTSTAGCVSQVVATSSLIVNPLPILSISSTATVICLGEGIILTANGANTYTWTGGLNTNSIAVSPSVSTTYSASGTSTDGCVGSNTLQLNITESTNIKTIVSKASIKVYPNPTNGEFTIELGSVNNTYITITNVLGQIIKTQKAELINQINLNLFDKGIYFINVMDNNQSVYKGSIIKE